MDLWYVWLLLGYRPNYLYLETFSDRRACFHVSCFRILAKFCTLLVWC